MKKRLLWIDDCRDPFDSKMDWLSFSPIGRNVEVYWAKSYLEFTEWVRTNGLPDAVCFDHDLGDESADEKTGLDCAKFLIDLCIDEQLTLPQYSSQSSNPVGRENILMLLSNYEKFQS